MQIGAGEKEGKPKKPLTDLQLRAFFPKTDQNGKNCDEVCTDVEETKEKQENRIEYFQKGNLQFTEEGRNAEITVDRVLHARAKPSENKDHGPRRHRERDDPNAAHGECPHYCEVFSVIIVRMMEFPIVKSCETRVLEIAGCSPY